MTVIKFPNGVRPRKQGFISPRSELPANVQWLREPYRGLAVTPERLLLAAIVKAMPERQSAKVLASIGQLIEAGSDTQAIQIVAIDMACGSFAPVKPST